jgi:uncharacterized protein involved in exopolysaccharide biosynthesis
MDKESNELQVRDDEINLYELWQVLVKRKKLIIGLFLVSMILAAVISLLMPKIYQGEAVLTISAKDISAVKDATSTSTIMTVKEIIPAQSLISVIDPMNCEKINVVSPKNAAAIIRARFLEIKGSTDKFRVSIEAKDPAKIPEFIKDLVNYLNNLPVIKRSVENCREQLTKRASELANVIEQSGVSKKTYEKMLRDGKLTIIGFSPILLDRQFSDLKIEKLTIEQRLENLSGIDVLEQPGIPTQPIRPRIKMNIALAGMASLFFGIFLAFFLEFVNKMKAKGRG